AVSVDFQIEDVSDLSAAEVSLRVHAEARRPFELENGPLFRVRLFADSQGDSILLLAIHHIVSDFWSIAVLIDELGRLYPALRSGRPADLVPLRRQAADFARWQAARLAKEDGDGLWTYWRSKLAGQLPVIDFPTDRPRPAVQTDRGSRRSLLLDHTLTEHLA